MMIQSCYSSGNNAGVPIFTNVVEITQMMVQSFYSTGNDIAIPTFTNMVEVTPLRDSDYSIWK